MASGSKEKPSQIRGKTRKLFFKESQQLAEQLSAVSGEDWVGAVASYASDNELHLQIFPERNVLHRKIMAKHASQLGLFLQGLVKKYLELYTGELGASATMLFSFIEFLRKTFDGETKLSELWLSIIDGENQETARHIGNMYGLALMYRVNKFIEKENASKTGKKEVCHSVELDDYTSVSLTPSNKLTSTNKTKCQGFQFSPSLAVKGDKKAVSAAHSTSLNDIARRKSKRRCIPSTFGAHFPRLSSGARSNTSPECVISAKSVTLSSSNVSTDSFSSMSPNISSPVNSVSSLTPVSGSLNSVLLDNSVDSASTSVQLISSIPISCAPCDSSILFSTTIELGNSVSSCVSTPSLSKQTSSKVEASSMSLALPSPKICTSLKTHPVNGIHAKMDSSVKSVASRATRSVTRSVTKHITTAAQRPTRRHIISSNPKPSRLIITKDSSRWDATSKLKSTARQKKINKIAVSSKCKILPTRGMSTERATSAQRKASTKKNSLVARKTSIKQNSLMTRKTSTKQNSLMTRKTSTKQNFLVTRKASTKQNSLMTRKTSTKRNSLMTRKASTKQNSLKAAVNSTRSGRVPKKKSVLDL
ncbi:uncharacterized protein [Procambarus clarkii]|uniref:uncharacterized protein n=1 Tax=Procambarus clarkii TaxID=6728 RepID=UPI001E676025|nr:endochitinase A-like [Procambarus clarkii]